MSLAIFGITNSSLNLVATLFVLMLVVLWLALIVYTYLDARRRISDPFLVACATVASFFPFIGTAVYAIVRPPEFLEDAHERELEIKAAELRVRQLREQSCPNCEYPVEKNFLRCPNCQRRLKDPCPTCSKPVDPRWELCPYCESTLGGSGGERQRRPQKRQRPPAAEAEREPERREAPKRQPARRKKTTSSAKQASVSDSRKESTRRAPKEAAPEPQPDQRSPSREPDPDPRQA
jgi:hypothetical protein